MASPKQTAPPTAARTTGTRIESKLSTLSPCGIGRNPRLRRLVFSTRLQWRSDSRNRGEG